MPLFGRSLMQEDPEWNILIREPAPVVSAPNRTYSTHGPALLNQQIIRGEPRALSRYAAGVYAISRNREAVS